LGKPGNNFYHLTSNFRAEALPSGTHNAKFEPFQEPAAFWRSGPEDLKGQSNSILVLALNLHISG
jgi:hypothetical protein